MTDAEDELRRSAQEMKNGGIPSLRLRAKYDIAANPAAVLALLDRIEALERAAQRASAELRHALSYRKPDGCIDTNLVSRAIVELETATTPNRPEVKP